MNRRTSTLTAVVLALVLSRLVPHPWNVSPLTAAALFSGARFERRWLAFGVPLGALLLSDMILGFYRWMPAVYGAFALVVLLGRGLLGRRSAVSVALATIGSSALFFVVTNAAVWLEGALYPRTVAGLAACFAAAVPFFQHTLLGDAFFSAVLFVGLDVAERRIPALAPAVMAR